MESFIQAAIAVLYTTRSDDEEDDRQTIKSTTSTIISSLTANKSNTRLRLKALLALLNLVSETDIKYDILLSLLDFAISTNNSRLVSHFHHRVEQWIVNWQLSILQRRNLYQKISELLSADNQNSLSLIFLIKYFDTYAGETYPVEVEIIAQTAVLSAIKSPVSSFTDRSALLEVLR